MVYRTPIAHLFIYSVALLISFSALTAYAQVSDDTPTDPSSSGMYCPQLTQTMQKYSCDAGLVSSYCKSFVAGTQVTGLQLFLTDFFDLDEAQTVTGLFGKTTQKYLVQFQRQYGLPAYGIAGSLTRAKIAQLCGTTSTTTTTTCPMYQRPLCGVGEEMVQKDGGTSGCPGPLVCVPRPADAAFVDIKVNGSDGAVSMPADRMATVSWNTRNVTDCDIANAQVSRVGAQEMVSRGYLPPSGSQYVFLNGGSVILTCSDKNGKKVEDTVPITDVTAHMVHVITPNGGETFPKGAPFTSRVSVNGLYPAGTRICINLTHQATGTNNVPFYGIDGTAHCAAVDASKQYQEVVISGQLAGGNTSNYLPAGMYKARAFTTFASGAHKSEYDVFDESDAAFTVVEQGTDAPMSVRVTLEDPTGQGKETFSAGQQLVVRWNVDSFKGVDPQYQTGIELFPYGANEATVPAKRIVRVAETTTFPHVHTWNVTAQGLFGDTVPSGRYMVRVVVYSKQTGGYIVGQAGPIGIVTDATPTTSPVTITAPNGGERIALGSAYTIQARMNASVPAGTSVCTMVLHEGGPLSNFPPRPQNCDTYTGGGLYTKQVSFTSDDAGVLGAGRYKVLMTVDGLPIVNNTYTRLGQDESDAWFELTGTAPSTGTIKVTAPNGGEQWEEGVLNSITWGPYGYNPDTNPSRDVDAYLEMKNPNGTFTNLGSVIPSGKASIHWITGFVDPYNYRTEADRGVGIADGTSFAIPGSNYYIRVVNHVTGAWDRSDAPFTITPKRIDLKINNSDTPVTMRDAIQRVTATWSVSPGHTGCYLYGSVTGTAGANTIGLPGTSGSMDIEANLYGQQDGQILLRCNQRPLQDGDPAPLETMNQAAVTDSVLLVRSNVPLQPAYIQVTSPNGGTPIDLAQQQSRITWQMTGVASPLAIALYKNDAWYAWITKAAYVTPSPDNNYAFGWNPNMRINFADGSSYIPPTASDGSVYKIYITGQRADGTGYVDDKSDTPFSFAAQPVATPPMKNAQSCDVIGANTGVLDGQFACLGMWDFGNDFGGDVHMCGDYGASKTGCTTVAPMCKSGTAIATRVIGSFGVTNDADVNQLASWLATTPDVVRKGVAQAWVYECSPKVAAVGSQSASVIDSVKWVIDALQVFKK